MRTTNIIWLVLLSVALISCGGDEDNGTKPDTTPPTVASTIPASGAINVNPKTAISVTFSEAIDSATINSTTFAVSGNPAGIRTVNGRTATFTPDNDLAISQLYAIAVTTGVKDLAGNALQANYVWQFTTADVILVDGADYFPMAEGDTWYYKDGSLQSIKREVSGDTVINNTVCKRIIENGSTAQAWSIDSTGFYVHFIVGDYPYRFDPPLKIPFGMAYDEVYTFNSDVYWLDSTAVYSGQLKFKGYLPYTVPAGTFDDAIRFLYINESYNEYYGKGVGLLDDEDYVLDSAYIGGVWYR